MILQETVGGREKMRPGCVWMVDAFLLEGVTISVEGKVTMSYLVVTSPMLQTLVCEEGMAAKQQTNVVFLLVSSYNITKNPCLELT